MRPIQRCPGPPSQARRSPLRRWSTSRQGRRGAVPRPGVSDSDPVLQGKPGIAPRAELVSASTANVYSGKCMVDEFECTRQGPDAEWNYFRLVTTADAGDGSTTTAAGENSKEPPDGATGVNGSMLSCRGPSDAAKAQRSLTSELRNCTPLSILSVHHSLYYLLYICPNTYSPVQQILH